MNGKSYFRYSHHNEMLDVNFYNPIDLFKLVSKFSLLLDKKKLDNYLPYQEWFFDNLKNKNLSHACKNEATYLLNIDVDKKTIIYNLNVFDLPREIQPEIKSQYLRIEI
jgi:hypothetical protein